MKTYDVYLLPDAIKDLESIYEYVTEQSGFPENDIFYGGRDYETIMSAPKANPEKK